MGAVIIIQLLNIQILICFLFVVDYSHVLAPSSFSVMVIVSEYFPYRLSVTDILAIGFGLPGVFGELLLAVSYIFCSKSQTLC